MRRRFTALLAMLLLLLSVNISAKDVLPIEGVIVSGGMVTGLTGAAAEAEELFIPARSGGRAVEIIYRIKSDKVKSIVLPDTVKTIYEGAFTGCPNLESINLAGVTSIYSRAFEGCSALTNIGNGNRLLRGCYVGDRAFAGTGLHSLILDRSLGPDSGGSGAFEGCENLNRLSITSGVSIIDAGAFAGNTSLEYVCMPQSLDRLSDGAFSGCTGLRTVVFPIKNVVIEDDGTPIFADCPNLTIVGMAGTTAETYARTHGIPFIPSVIPVTSVSTMVASASCTATVTINGTDIPAYTVDGSVYVGENVIKCFGITCDWNRPTRSTLITIPEGMTFSVSLNTNPEPYDIGIFSSDTVFYRDGFRIPAFNVGNGESIIDINALAGEKLY
ncbi:MAG: leucine-rich repeat domain-containing protein [Oscillospiraceae bacterium]|nr:leucine-rich repeat domain-containing protein [Oscillospiraceae bacterium]